jgi:predicted  nucleic acid-binding Zn-ribbon protein
MSCKTPCKNGVLLFLLRKLKTMNKIIMIALVAALAVQCSPSSEKKVEEAQNEIKRDIKKEKDEATKDLRELRDDINDKLDKISNKLDKASASAKQDLESSKESLIVQRTKIETALDNIDKAAENSWDDIQQAARNTASEVKVEFEAIRAKVDAALDHDDGKKDENK